MSMCSLTDFIEVSPWSGADVGSHRNRHRPGGLSGGYLSEGWGLLVAKSGDFCGHQRGPQMAITGDFLVATDICAQFTDRRDHRWPSIHWSPMWRIGISSAMAQAKAAAGDRNVAASMVLVRPRRRWRPASSTRCRFTRCRCCSVEAADYLTCFQKKRPESEIVGVVDTPRGHTHPIPHCLLIVTVHTPTYWARGLERAAWWQIWTATPRCYPKRRVSLSRGIHGMGRGMTPDEQESPPGWEGSDLVLL